MTKHRFKIGDRVRMQSGPEHRSATAVLVVRHLPADHENLPLRYRIKVPNEAHERMVTEDQLSGIT